MSKFFCEGNKVYLRSVQLSDVPLIVKWKNDPLIQKMALSPDISVPLENQKQDTKRVIGSDDMLCR